MENKFRPILQAKIDNQRALEKEQKDLRAKYEIEDESKTVIVEKPSAVRTGVRLIEKLVAGIVTVIIVLLVAIGILALAYEPTRLIIEGLFISALKSIGIG